MKALEIYCKEKGICCCKDESLARHTSFKIGGKAGLFLEPSSVAQIAELTGFCHDNAIPMIILGNGSNSLFPDDGFAGAVMHLGDRFAKIRQIGETAVHAQAGASLKSVCEFAAERGLAGLEFAFGIPGSVGGAVFMNAGAYGGEMKDVVYKARHVTSSGKLGGFTDDKLDFEYRHSVYSGGSYIITSADFMLCKGDPAEIRARMDDLLARRRHKQPLEWPSAGSTFRRPEGGYASELIDRCGLKGRQVGGAMVSEKHAGFVINAGGATCADVLSLIDVIRSEVLEKTGFDLKPEVRVIK